MATAMADGTARASAGSLLVLLFVALAGVADLASATAGGASTTVAFSGDDDNNNNAAAALLTPTPPSPGEVSGFMQCLLGCITEVFGCSFGCMGKGPDLPLCVISCDQKSVVCMIRCGLSPSPSPPKPSPPGPKPPSPKPPKPPTPKPPTPKPPTPKPPTPSPPTPDPPTPAPGPPYSPPYAVTGRKIATSA